MIIDKIIFGKKCISLLKHKIVISPYQIPKLYKLTILLQPLLKKKSWLIILANAFKHELFQQLYIIAIITLYYIIYLTRNGDILEHDDDSLKIITIPNKERKFNHCFFFFFTCLYILTISGIIIDIIRHPYITHSILGKST